MEEEEPVPETIVCPHCKTFAFRTKKKVCDSCGWTEP